MPEDNTPEVIAVPSDAIVIQVPVEPEPTADGPAIEDRVAGVVTDIAQTVVSGDAAIIQTVQETTEECVSRDEQLLALMRETRESMAEMRTSLTELRQSQTETREILLSLQHPTSTTESPLSIPPVEETPIVEPEALPASDVVDLPVARDVKKRLRKI